MKVLNFIRRNIHSLLSLLGAAGVFVYEGRHFFTHKELNHEVLLVFVANLLALLALVIVVERLRESGANRKLSGLWNEIRILRREMQRKRGITFIEGQERIYNRAAALFEEVDLNIKILLMEVAAPAPEEFGERLAQILQQHPGASCDLVIVVEKPDEAFWTENDKRLLVYEKRGVTKFRPYIVEVVRPIGVNIAVVDHKHALIGFPPLPAIGEMSEAAVVFDSKPKIAGMIAHWFDNLPGRTPYSQARSEYLKRKSLQR